MSCHPLPCKEVDAGHALRAPSRASKGQWVLAATVLGSSMEFIDGTVVNVSLPSLQSDFHASGVQAQWVVECYALFLSSMLLIGGSIGDRLGLRRTFVSGVIIFAIASVSCGLAPNIALLFLARGLQGVGGALLVPNSLALLSSSYSDVERGKAIGTWSGFIALMTAIGPIMGRCWFSMARGVGCSFLTYRSHLRRYGSPFGK